MKKSPLYSVQDEKTILKMALDYKDVRHKIFSGLTVFDFFSEKNRGYYESLLNDYIRVGDLDVMKMSGEIHIYSDPTWYVSPHFCDEIIARLRDCTRKRSIKRASEDRVRMIESYNGEAILSKAIEGLALIQATSSTERTAVADIYKTVMGTWEKIKGREIIGFPTDTFLDKYIYGYQQGHYWVIGAYTNYGKTTYMSHLAKKVIRNKGCAVIFSTEMSKEQTLEKILVQACEASLYDIRTYTNGHMENIQEVVNSKTYIYDTCYTVEAMNMELVALRARGVTPDVVFIDFLQNVESKEKTNYEKITDITHSLQRLAKELSVCVVALSQISNDGNANKGNTIPFKGSGDIASTADLALQIFRNKTEEDIDSPTAELTISIVKNRHGPNLQSGKKLYLNKSNGVIEESTTPATQPPPATSATTLWQDRY